MRPDRMTFHFMSAIRPAGLAALLFAVAPCVTGCQTGEIVDGLVAQQQQQAEICGDGIDNDGDGLADCDDSSCFTDPSCASTGGPLQPPWGVCADVSGDRSNTPVDVIWAIDGSASMKEEIDKVVYNVNLFANYLLKLHADVRMVLLGDHSSLCVPPPLGGPNCTDGERYRHVKRYVGNDALKQIIELYPQYRDFLRPNARKVFVLVSDANSDVSALWFRNALMQLDGGHQFDDFIVHSIVAFSDQLKPHPTGCQGAIAEGTVYLDLSQKTGGLRFPICEQRWDGIFAELGQSVAGLVDIPCDYALPQGGPSGNPSAGQLQVSADVGGQWVTVNEVSDASACTTQLGWYASGDKTRLCPSICRGLVVTEVRLQYGCSMQLE